MIKTLSIKNFILIDQLKIRFDKGLNILTGETGAGKSILIDAIDTVFGARSSKDLIKTGKDKACIELCLLLPELFPHSLLEENGIDPENDNSLIISREISQNGTRSRINGVLVTQSYIQKIREYLIDIHSQYETYNYIQPKTHINLLDSYGNNDHQALIKDFNKIYAEFKQVKQDLDTAKAESQHVEQKIDFLKFQINEIKEAKIENINEYDDLVQERQVLLNAEQLRDVTFSGYNSLYGQDSSIVDILGQLENKLAKASDYDNNLSAINEIIISSTINIKDAADQLRDYYENLDADPERLTLIQERIDILEKLKRKYGPNLVDVLNNLESFEQEFNYSETKSERIEELTQNLNLLQEKLNNISQKLSDSRKILAKLLSDLIQQELIKLEMPKAQFLINIEKKNDISSNGIDSVEFLISPNQGESLKPLAKIASGGEISRVMLAIKTIFARADQVNTVIFDEIDTGISGKTSQSVAEALAGLAKSHQVICITHQPIIAAMADNYLYIEKVMQDKTTHVKVTSLNTEEKIIALSKLASGSADDKDSLNFAAKLIQQASDFKESYCLN